MSLEALARSMSGGLTYDSEHDGNGLDLLTAMACGSVTSTSRAARESILNSLGVSLIALKMAGRADLFKRAVIELKDCLRWRIRKMGQRDRLLVAKVVIDEWVQDGCHMCRGAKHIFDEGGVKRPCMVCVGTGKHRYSDAERAEALGVDSPEAATKWSRALGIGHFQVGFAVAYASRNAYEKLGAQTEEHRAKNKKTS